jgi:hypothetical protein
VYVEDAINVLVGHGRKHMHEMKLVIKKKEPNDNTNMIKPGLNVKLFVTKSVPNMI